MKSIIKKLGLGYNNIDTCSNDCAIFWKENADLDNCPKCDASRWKTTDEGLIVTLANG